MVERDLKYRETDKGVYFWGHVYSNWYKTTLNIDGTIYNCVEQYMMAEKARLSNDQETLEKIMLEKNPFKQKMLGRMVKNFKGDDWDKVKVDVVYKACMVKFSKPELKEILLNTGDKVIAEASPKDAIWGIFLHYNDERCEDKTKWQGLNLLGEVLMRVRKDLRIIDDMKGVK